MKPRGVPRITQGACLASTPLILWFCDELWEAAQTEVGVLERMSGLEITQVVSKPRAIALGLFTSIWNIPFSCPHPFKVTNQNSIPQTRINNISSQIVLQQQSGMFFPLEKDAFLGLNVLLECPDSPSLIVMTEFDSTSGGRAVF